VGRPALSRTSKLAGVSAGTVNHSNHGEELLARQSEVGFGLLAGGEREAMPAPEISVTPG